MCAPSVLPKSIRPPVGWLLVINMNFKASKALRSCSARVSLPAASSVCPERLQGANRPSVWQINDVTILRFFDTLETVNSVNSLNKRQIYAFKLFFRESRATHSAFRRVSLLKHFEGLLGAQILQIGMSLVEKSLHSTRLPLWCSSNIIAKSWKLEHLFEMIFLFKTYKLLVCAGGRLLRKTNLQCNGQYHYIAATKRCTRERGFVKDWTRARNDLHSLSESLD